MPDYLRTALLLEEKASRLPRGSEQRAYLLAVATAARRLGLELLFPYLEFDMGRGSHQKRSYCWARLALKMRAGPERAELECKAERAAICYILLREGRDLSFDDYAYRVANYCSHDG